MTSRLTRTIAVLPFLMPVLPVLFAVSLLSPAVATEPAQQTTSDATPAADKVQATVDRALQFLIDDAARWRSTRGCATCHHGAMTIWALSEAKSHDYTVPADTLNDNIQWTKDLFVPQFSKPRDHRWGYNFVSLPGIYLSLMSQTVPILTRDEINRVAVHLERHQEADGAWLVPPPHANIAPPTWESAETIALWALLAWEQHVPADPQAAETARTSRNKAVAWLANVKPTDTTQSLTLRLLLDIRTAQPAQQLQSKIEQLLALQNADGGWSQLKDRPSDAYATGQVLWVLSFTGLQADHPQVGRAITFLTATQQENGSWPMTARHHPDEKVTKERYLVPITYFGSALGATLGLVRLVPAKLDPATMQQRALTAIRGLSGTHEVDAAAPDRPVVGINVRYEVDDDQLAKLARLLTAFPQLKSLQFTSLHITDAGAAHLKPLVQLRKLSLEQASITDATLANLKGLTNLEELNLKGTKVSDAGVADFQRELPNVKVLR